MMAQLLRGNVLFCGLCAMTAIALALAILGTFA